MANPLSVEGRVGRTDSWQGLSRWEVESASVREVVNMYACFGRVLHGALYTSRCPCVSLTTLVGRVGVSWGGGYHVCSLW